MALAVERLQDGGNDRLGEMMKQSDIKVGETYRNESGTVERRVDEMWRRRTNYYVVKSSSGNWWSKPGQSRVADSGTFAKWAFAKVEVG